MPLVSLATLLLSRPAPPDHHHHHHHHRGILFLVRYHRKLLLQSYNARIAAREVTLHETARVLGFTIEFLFFACILSTRIRVFIVRHDKSLLYWCL